MGTPEFSLNCLQALIENNHNVAAVFTQPDKPKGRKYKLTAPPVKELALKYDIPVYQPNSLKDDQVINSLKEKNPDVIVVVAFGKILPKEILSIPRYGCINVHASLLPKYRGAAPIQWSIINGEKTTGVTTMLMDEGLDMGDMLLKALVEIEPDDTAGTLHDKLSKTGGALLIETLNKIENNELSGEKQDDKKSCYSPMISKKDGVIDWNKDAYVLNNFIRGMNPWPVASTKLNGKMLKIYSANVLADKNCAPGEVISTAPLTVGCADNTAIELCEVQIEGKKRMRSEDFLKGHKIELGTVLG